MTLESKLFELATLVDYGTYYLVKANETDLSEVFAHLDDYDVSTRDLLRPLYGYKLEEAIDTLVQQNGADVFLDGISARDVFNWVKDNYNVDDVFNIDDIVDYVKDNYDVDDLIETDMRWR